MIGHHDVLDHAGDDLDRQCREWRGADRAPARTSLHRLRGNRFRLNRDFALSIGSVA
jgi:hypothetical protein